MKKAVFLFIIGLVATTRLMAQTGAADAGFASNTATAGIHIPFGEFAQTHLAGLSLGYAWSHQRFGKLNVLPKKMIGFTANAGIDYYLGKKEKVAGYNVKYGGYTYLHVAAGIIHNPSVKTNICLTAGPSLGIYKGNADMGLRMNLYGSYYITGKIAFSPALIYMKHAEANALWAAAVRAIYNF